MSLSLRRRVVGDPAETSAAPVSFLGKVPSPGWLAVVLALGRATIGAVLLAAPVPTTRALGVDSGTAKRAAFLTRMAAVRDVGLGVGTLTASDAGRRNWLLIGAGADAVDALTLGAAVRAGHARAAAGGAAAAGALGAALVAVVAVVGARHR